MPEYIRNGDSVPRILMLSRDLMSGGGVVNYVSMLMCVLSDDVSWKHFVIGRRVGETGGFKTIKRMLGDYVRFVVTLKTGRYDLVHINPSFIKRSLLRDLIFVRLVTLLTSMPLIVFIHGWDQAVFEWVMCRKWAIWLVGGILKKANTLLVLSQEFKHGLIRLGVHPDQIKVESTMFSGKELGSISPVTLDQKDTWRLLFLSRVVIEKGIIELLDAVAELVRENRDLELLVAGDGPALGQAKDHARNIGVEQSVHFIGYVRGEVKRLALSSSQLFVLPSYREGCPVSLLEAMACGLPVVATRVGGIPEVMEDNKNGILLDTVTSNSIASALRKLMDDRDLWRRVSDENQRSAWARFEANSAAQRILNIYRSLVVTETLS